MNNDKIFKQETSLFFSYFPCQVFQECTKCLYFNWNKQIRVYKSISYRSSSFQEPISILKYI